MAYASLADLTEAYGEVELARLTTPEGADVSGAINVARAETALATASDEIDSYLRRRYGVPLAVTPLSVNRACLTMARYQLGFGGAVQPSEPVRLAYKQAMEWLRDLNEGRASLEGVELASQVVGARTTDRRAHALQGDRGGRFQLPGSGLGIAGLW